MIAAVVEPWHPKTRYAPKRTPGATPVTTPFADDPRDVRPVTVAVVGIGIRHRDRGIRERCRVGVEVVAHEVPSREHAAGRAEAPTEIWIVVVDSRVHDRDVDVLAGDAEIVLHGVRADHPQRRREVDRFAVTGFRSRQRGRRHRPQVLDAVEATEC